MKAATSFKCKKNILELLGGHLSNINDICHDYQSLWGTIIAVSHMTKLFGLILCLCKLSSSGHSGRNNSTSGWPGNHMKLHQKYTLTTDKPNKL